MKEVKFVHSMIPAIQNISSFKFLSETEMIDMISKSSILMYGEHEKIINQDDVDQNLFAVIKGCVKVTVEENDKEAYICTLGKAEIFGEAGMFMNVKRSANVIAAEDSIILKIDRHSMLTFIKNNPSAGNKIFMVMIHGLLSKLKEANRELAYERKEDIDQNDVDDLVANLLNNKE
ncbi:MAG: cyclic nucleotide-binding domain-containing protein [Spirochaetaceae bacterium]